MTPSTLPEFASNGLILSPLIQQAGYKVQPKKIESAHCFYKSAVQKYVGHRGLVDLKMDVVYAIDIPRLFPNITSLKKTNYSIDVGPLSSPILDILDKNHV
jgi:hypothetical protein